LIGGWAQAQGRFIVLFLNRPASPGVAIEIEAVAAKAD
jgi:hypothetical protein